VLCGGGTGQNTCNGDSGGPLIVRNAEGKAIVLGVTSHGPDCQSQPNNPNYAYGFYTDVRKYLDAITTWQQGKEYQWTAPPSSSGSGSSGSGSSSGGAASQPPSYDPSPVVWQPVPGWSDQWGSGWGTGTNAGSSSWTDLFCQVFGC
jgi:secreted trypsin-like serine protease